MIQVCWLKWPRFMNKWLRWKSGIDNETVNATNSEELRARSLKTGVGLQPFNRNRTEAPIAQALSVHPNLFACCKKPAVQ